MLNTKLIKGFVVFLMMLAVLVTPIPTTYGTTLYPNEQNLPALTNIIIQLGVDEAELNFTWFSLSSAEGRIAYAKEMDLVENQLPFGATTVVADRTDSVKDGYYGNKATITGLEPNTTYCYQITNGNDKTEIKRIITGTDSFSFAFAGDAQIGRGYGTDATQNWNCIADDGKAWGLTLQQMMNSAEFAGIDFLVSAGDQINSSLASYEGHELQWDAYSNHKELLEIPTVTVIGNHDNNYPNAIYPYHVNQPNMLKKLNGTYFGATYQSGKVISADYYFTYGNVLFMVLNTNTFKANDASAEDVSADIAAAQDHCDFIDRVMAETKEQEFDWTIVLYHQSPYGSSYHGNYTLTDKGIYLRTEQYAYNNIKKYLFPKLYDVGVDLVLSGHDHCYTRTHILKPVGYGVDASVITAYNTDEYHSYYVYADGSTVPKYVSWTDLNLNTYQNLKVASAPVKVVNPDGILHITAATSSGSQVNPAAYENMYTAVKATANTRHMSRVDITEDELTIVTYNMGQRTTESITLVDCFTIVKECAHTGGIATCECKAFCELCGEAYASLDHSFADGSCSACGLMRGDLDGNGMVNEDDAIYLLQSVLMPDVFKLYQPVDYDGDSTVNEDDAVFLLQHVLMPGFFPLN